jgi:hypothetical protein
MKEHFSGAFLMFSFSMREQLTIDSLPLNLIPRCHLHDVSSLSTVAMTIDIELENINKIIMQQNVLLLHHISHRIFV